MGIRRLFLTERERHDDSDEDTFDGMLVFKTDKILPEVTVDKLIIYDTEKVAAGLR